jgi:hypothetical protein
MTDISDSIQHSPIVVKYGDEFFNVIELNIDQQQVFMCDGDRERFMVLPIRLCEFYCRDINHNTVRVDLTWQFDAITRNEGEHPNESK